MKHLFKVLAVSGLLVFGTLAANVSADTAGGSDGLGDPSITIAAGTGIVTAGTGLLTDGMETITIDVPHPVVQAILYWQRHSPGEPGLGFDAIPTLAATDSLDVNGTTVVGDRIGGATEFFNFGSASMYFATYRADITGMVSAGSNSLTITGVTAGPSDLTDGHDGAGLLVIYDDGTTTADVQVRDGIDLAFCGFSGDLQTTVPQAFTFAPADAMREGTMSMFYGSIAANRGSTVNILVDGVLVDSAVDLLGNTDGPEWDTLTRTFQIPAGATTATVEVLSSGGAPYCASLSWVGAGLAIPDVPMDGGEGCTPGYWRQPQHLDSWAPTGYAPGDNFNATFGVVAPFIADNCDRPDDTPSSDPTLLKAVWCRAAGVHALARHATAALLNASHPDVDYDLSASEIIALVQSAVASGHYGPAKNQLAELNERGCPLD